VAFLHEWAELIEGSDGPTLSRHHEWLAGALDRCSQAKAQLVAA
jgi:hypothetical protein